MIKPWLKFYFVPVIQKFESLIDKWMLSRFTLAGLVPVSP